MQLKNMENLETLSRKEFQKKESMIKAKDKKKKFKKMITTYKRFDRLRNHNPKTVDTSHWIRKISMRLL